MIEQNQMYGVDKEIKDNPIAMTIVKYCRKGNKMMPATFFKYKKHATQVNLQDWQHAGKPYLLLLQFANKEISKQHFAIYKDVGYGLVFAVNLKTMEVLHSTHTIPVYNQSGKELRGMICNSNYYSDSDKIVCMEVC